MSTSLRDLLRVPTTGFSPADLAAIDPGSTPGAPQGGKKAARAAAARDGEKLSVLQEHLWAEAKGAEGVSGGPRRLLLVLQGMDTSGKDGTTRHVVGNVTPAGVRVTSFGKPTRTELAHDFLWRIRKALPLAGEIGVFNRSHYEDVLVVRVHRLVPATQWRPRFAAINDFEAELAAAGTTVVKVMLHLSLDEQRDRLLARLEEPDKRWKFRTGDISERARWASYQAAYADALRRTSTAGAPWYVVPADRKWYRDFAVGRILRETLEAMAPTPPQPTLDVETLIAELRAG